VIALMMEVVSFSEILGSTSQNTWCNIPEDSHLQIFYLATEEKKSLLNESVEPSLVQNCGLSKLFISYYGLVMFVSLI
jgi:hypothetical protein